MTKTKRVDAVSKYVVESILTVFAEAALDHPALPMHLTAPTHRALARAMGLIA